MFDEVHFLIADLAEEILNRGNVLHQIGLTFLPAGRQVCDVLSEDEGFLSREKVEEKCLVRQKTLITLRPTSGLSGVLIFWII